MILSQRYTDTLCGTKVLTKANYEKIKLKNRDLGNFDPFVDFFIIFGSSRLCLKMCEIPIRYKARSMERHSFRIFARFYVGENGDICFLKLKQFRCILLF